MKTVKADTNVQNAEGDQAVFTKVFSFQTIFQTMMSELKYFWKTGHRYNPTNIRLKAQ